MEAAGAEAHGLRTVKHKELHPRLSWQNWTKQNLPNSRYYITDIDNVIRSSDGQIMLLEIKSFGATMTTSQRAPIAILHKAMEQLNGQTIEILAGATNITQKVDYKGSYCITFTGAEGDFSKPVFCNSVLITEYQLINLLSFQTEVQP